MRGYKHVLFRQGSKKVFRKLLHKRRSVLPISKTRVGKNFLVSEPLKGIFKGLKRMFRLVGLGIVLGVAMDLDRNKKTIMEEPDRWLH